jgi:metallo-beta-lactamase family protein
MKITFLGGVGTVTGSKYLVEQNGTKILIDCGLLQGDDSLTHHNWDPLPIDPSTIDALVITHGHIDHTGYIPLLVKNGFRGPIYCSHATSEICAILLLDSGSLQEEKAKIHHTTPLYTKDDAAFSLQFLKTIDYDTQITVKDLQITLVRSGHILGSAFVLISDGKQKLFFSGDLGRPEQPILKSPPYIKETDFLVLESTYGSRVHAEDDPEKMLSTAIHETVKKGGVVIIPSFSLMRTQTILYYLYQLKKKGQLPEIPIFVDSPTGIAINNLFCKFADEQTLSSTLCHEIFTLATPTPTVEESKKIDRISHSAIVIAGSGMAEGGRVPHHLEQFISDPKNTVLFVGYQSKSSRGRQLVDGAKEIQIYDKTYPVRASIKMIHSLSAHADADEILAWLSHFTKAPKRVFLTHGESDSAQALKKKIEERFKWNVIIPAYQQSFDLE